MLEDGRVIEEDDPEVTVDTVEDIESHSDDCDDDVKHIGKKEASIPYENMTGFLCKIILIYLASFGGSTGSNNIPTINAISRKKFLQK